MGHRNQSLDANIQVISCWSHLGSRWLLPPINHRKHKNYYISVQTFVGIIVRKLNKRNKNMKKMWLLLQFVWLSSGWPIRPQLAVVASTSWSALFHEWTVSLWLWCGLHHVHCGKCFGTKILTSWTIIKLRVTSGEWPPVNFSIVLRSY